MNAKKIEITLYLLFYDVIEMNRLVRSKNGRFELSQTQAGTKKEPFKRILI